MASNGSHRQQLFGASNLSAKLLTAAVAYLYPPLGGWYREKLLRAHSQGHENGP